VGVNYTAFGLKIAAISSRKLPDPNEGNVDNKNLYNDKELIDEADLNWYDYGFRNYDPQIGRFTQLDPLTDDYPELTPYQYAGNEPIANVDLDGLEPYKVLETVNIVSKPGFFKTAIKIISKSSNLVSVSSKVLQVGLRSVGDNTLVKNTKRDPRVPLSKNKTGGIAFTSKNGQGGSNARRATNPDGQPESLDMMLDMFNMATKQLKPDFSDPLAYPELLQKVLELYQDVKDKSKTATKPKKFENTEEVNRSSPKENPNQSRTNIAAMFKKKGNVIYHRDAGYKTITNGDGTQTIAPGKRATDTFPKEKSYGYRHPY
jgi:RHS repeat-associated protein